jgi:hypothetical protein
MAVSAVGPLKDRRLIARAQRSCRGPASRRQSIRRAGYQESSHRLFRRSVYSEHEVLESQNSAVVGFLSTHFRRVSEQPISRTSAATSRQCEPIYIATTTCGCSVALCLRRSPVQLASESTSVNIPMMRKTDLLDLRVGPSFQRKLTGPDPIARW